MVHMRLWHDAGSSRDHVRRAGVLRRGDECTFEAGVVKLVQTMCGDAAGTQALLSQISLDELAHLAGSRSAELQKHYAQLMDDLQHASAAAPPAASIAPDQHCRASSAVVTQSMSSFPDLLRESHGPRVPTLRSQAGNAILRASFSGSSGNGDEIRAAPGPHVSGQTFADHLGATRSTYAIDAASPRSPFAALHLRHSSIGAEGSLTPLLCQPSRVRQSSSGALATKGSDLAATPAGALCAQGAMRTTASAISLPDMRAACCSPRRLLRHLQR